MNRPQPNYGSQQPYPPQSYPSQQSTPQPYQQYPQQQYGYQPQTYGPYQPPKKSKMPMMIGIIVAIVVIIIVLVVIFLVVLKPTTQAMTATQVLDDYEEWNYRSFNDGDTITLKDKISDIDESWSSTWLTFDYTGSNSMYQWTGFSVEVKGDIGSCKVGDEITLKATVKTVLSVELHPESLEWNVADTSSCSS